jgi:hypothetical protein
MQDFINRKKNTNITMLLEEGERGAIKISLGSTLGKGNEQVITLQFKNTLMLHFIPTILLPMEQQINLFN